MFTSDSSKAIPLRVRHSSYKITDYEKYILLKKSEDEIIEVRHEDGTLKFVSLPEKQWQWYGSLSKVLPKKTFRIEAEKALTTKILFAFALGGVDIF